MANVPKRADRQRKGRPRRAEPKPGERVPLGLRVTPDVKSQLDKAAEQSGRSQSQEAEFRLEQSFRDQRIFDEALTLAYGPEGAAILAMVGELIKSIGFWAPQFAMVDAAADRKWIDDPFLFDEIVKAANRLFALLRPRGEPNPPKQFVRLLERIGEKSAEALMLAIISPLASSAQITKTGWVDVQRARLDKTLYRLGAPTAAHIAEVSR
jgi:hypothetical protein